MAKILLVDDQESFLTLVSLLLTSKGYAVHSLTDGKAALQALDREPFDLVICDIYMQPVSGLTVLQYVRERHPQIPVIMLTGYATVESALESMKLGAFDYIRKPFEMSDMAWTVGRALNREEQTRLAHPTPTINYCAKDVVSHSSAMQEAVRTIASLGSTHLPLLLMGEPGVGKRTLAKAVQSLTRRPPTPFFPLNCAELGAQASAQSNTVGQEHDTDLSGVSADVSMSLTDDLNGGTLCLEHVELLPAAFQMELLKALERTGPMGGQISADFHVIATTYADISKYVEQKLFNARLRERLGRFTVRIPPLRERRDDILPLTWHFLRKRFGNDHLPEIESDVRGALEHYDWPGNVRELRDVVASLPPAAENRVTRDCLPEPLRKQVVESAPKAVEDSPRIAQGHWLREFLRAREAELLRQIEGSAV